MSVLRRQSLTAYGAPLSETMTECPQPRGSELLVRITRCGVCHSDLHIQDGYFLLGPEKKLDVKAGRSLPFTLGHEITGVVEQVGAHAAEVEPGDKVAVFPWIGCRGCAACRRGQENICAAPRHLGINVDGGFASHVLVPHPRYLLRYGPLPEASAAILMCSGLTSYAALKRLADEAALGPLLLVGMGGVGMMGLILARQMFAEAPIIADIDPAKREAALAAGAAMAFDPRDQDARKKLLAATDGGVHGACDFVGSAQSVAFASAAIAKGGKVLVTGLFGGTLPMAVALFALKAMTIQGIQTGTLEEARELLAFARERNLVFPAIHERPLAEAQPALEALRAGRVVGRTVLVP
ncbi:MAG TPA: alcohol dehydrogenase catalytic domain-containing protein [Xanthobacteraceae bacterium]